MFPFFTICILGGIATYAAFRYFDLKDKYEAKCNEAHNLMLNLASEEAQRNADFVSLNVAYDRIDKLEEKYAELCDRTGTTAEDSFVQDLCDAMDDDACRCAGPCIQDTESTYEYDDNGNLVGPDGFTYTTTPTDDELEATGLYSEDGNIQLDRIKWTPDDLYTPDVDGDDEF